MPQLSIYPNAGHVLDSPITWETPWRTEGGFTHRLPAGNHPVHVGSCPYAPDGEDPARPGTPSPWS